MGVLVAEVALGDLLEEVHVADCLECAELCRLRAEARKES